jgi:simple sugar transport system ATP-binding protein
MDPVIDVLEMRNITKRFPGVLACDDVTLDVRSGEVLALLGENGAGKTTLMNVLYGLYRPDEGSIFVDGEEVSISDPSSAFALGIGMVHQHFMLVPNLTVLENVALGLCDGMGLRLDLESVRSRIEDVESRHDLPVQVDSPVWQLSVGEQQRVELVKILCLGAKLLILDEPTAALTPQETEELMALLRNMVSRGCSVVFISHKLNEVKAVSDRVAVLRSGKLVWEGSSSVLSTAELAEKMAGRTVSMPVSEAVPVSGKIVLRIDDVVAKGDRGTAALRGLSLDLHAGEIVGIAGVSGNGQRELAEVLNGLRPIEKGDITLGDETIVGLSPQKIIDMGMGYIPEDRMNEGIIKSFSVRENLILKDYFRPPMARGGFMDKNASARRARELIEEFDVRTPDMETPCSFLSGGNIQKVILARELSRRPSVLVAAYPIRGLDLGAAEFVHRRLLQAREEGAAVMLISEELDEIMDLSDRIAVIYEGKILEVLDRKDATREALGLLMAGVPREEARYHG